MPLDVLELSIFKVEVLSSEMFEPSTTNVPSISVLSKLAIPSISASPLISKVAASSSPLIVIFLPPVISLFESVIIALLAITVPFVIPSIRLIELIITIKTNKENAIDS